MAETLENPNRSSGEKSPPSSAMASLSLGIWPPTQRTRDAVARRLVEMLSSPSSALAKRYGALPADEAAAAAGSIEAAAFAAAVAGSEDGHVSSSVDAGLEILEKYSKEISARVLESAKSRSQAGKPDPAADEETERVEEAAGSEAKADA